MKPGFVELWMALHRDLFELNKFRCHRRDLVVYEHVKLGVQLRDVNLLDPVQVRLSAFNLRADWILSGGG